MIKGSTSFANDTVGTTKEAANNIGSSARDAANNVSDDIRTVANRAGQQARRVFFTAKDEIGTYAENVTGQIRQKPLQASLIALGAGLVVGLLLRGRK